MPCGETSCIARCFLVALGVKCTHLYQSLRCSSQVFLRFLQVSPVWDTLFWWIKNDLIASESLDTNTAVAPLCSLYKTPWNESVLTLTA